MPMENSKKVSKKGTSFVSKTSNFLRSSKIATKNPNQQKFNPAQFRTQHKGG